ncbi:MAG: translation elongation factor 4 [candidate division Zixibacteria bacterium]|nr:translation elongation factor 4 [candidate division Zixibacteria bacterium]MBU2623954.1 translation elongation factor 4 [candidate division Zixibacteria bacterium]
MDRIRNFSIIAHIDHGKSTLADRMLELTHTVENRDMHAQVLDSMDLEQERGITIKLHAIRIVYSAKDGKQYMLNLIDTPGHVDFTYEVSRSLAGCEGALLVVDASQGIEAQTISNLYLAMEHDLTIIPVINKIDLPHADVETTRRQIVDLLGVDEEEILLVSAKQGIGIEEVLEAIVSRVPHPKGNPEAPMRAMIFDSLFDMYRGAIPYIRVVDGVLNVGDQIAFYSNNKTFEVDELGFFRMRNIPTKKLSAGEVGYVIASIKNISDTKVGDTVFTGKKKEIQPLPGFRDIKPMVYAGIYPSVAENYEELRASIEKLKLNDASLLFEPETSVALGFGFRCGFLGLLHMEIIQERLTREYDLSIVNTVPNVEYCVKKLSGDLIYVDNPAFLPPRAEIDYIEEPYVNALIITPTEYIGNVMKLTQERRGIYKTTEYIDPTRATLSYRLPLAEIIFDFYDRLKSTTRGYASLDYDFCGFERSDLVKLDILINGDPVDAFSYIIHRSKAATWGRKLCSKLRELIPRQMFEVVIQAALGSRIISRETVRPLRKNVTAKCYGGDITRKRKLLERQKEGKRRMKQVGQVEIPQEAFLAVLQIEKD